MKGCHMVLLEHIGFPKITGKPLPHPFPPGKIMIFDSYNLFAH